MTKTLLQILILFNFINLSAQEIEFKNDQVLVDKIARFNFERKNASTLFTLFKLNTHDEIIFMSLDDNGTSSYSADDYRKFVFVENHVTVRTKVFGAYSWKKILKTLIEERVIDVDGNLNQERLQIFKEKYDDLGD